MNVKSVVRYGIVVVAIASIVVTILISADDSSHPEIRSSLELSEALGGDTTGFDRADRFREIRFPDDYGAHPGFRTEWWYYTGNIDTDAGAAFGYELTIFRIALSPPDTTTGSGRSNWATNQLFMGHFSLANVRDEQFYSFERFSRGAIGLAGATASPYRVWLEDWSIEGDGSDLFPTHIRAATDGVSIDLTLDSEKPVVLQGDRGLDRKGEGLGNASYYYSYTRLSTRGTITLDEVDYEVSGTSWKDHEWSTSALGPREVGWDWFALQLSDGREIMFYLLRESDGSSSAYTKGTLVEADGSSVSLGREDVDIQAINSWTSPRSGITYPSGWRMHIPTRAIELTITPLLLDQELNVSVKYWEGAVRIEGTTNGNSLEGRGYVELTGYGGT